MIEEETPAYIGKIHCGCIVSAVVDNDEYPLIVKEFLRECAQDNLIVERVTVGYIREHGFEKCAKHKNEISLQEENIDE